MFHLYQLLYIGADISLVKAAPVIAKAAIVVVGSAVAATSVAILAKGS